MDDYFAAEVANAPGVFTKSALTITYCDMMMIEIEVLGDVLKEDSMYMRQVNEIRGDRQQDSSNSMVSTTCMRRSVGSIASRLTAPKSDNAPDGAQAKMRRREARHSRQSEFETSDSCAA